MEPNDAAAAVADADAGEDYMSDLSNFLPQSDASPSRSLGRRKQPPSAAQPPARGRGQGQGQAKRAKGKGLPWQERRRKERERKQQEEDERTMAGLAEAIPESNVGFRLLKQMGYDPAARGAEPVGIEIRRGRSGLGAEPGVAAGPQQRPSEARTREEAERDRRREEEMAAELRARKSTQWRGRRLLWDYRKAEAALAQLENREVEPQASPEAEKEKGEEDEEEDVITEENLQNILTELRDQHHYCLYCGCKYESAEVLANECPGPHEDDH